MSQILSDDVRSKLTEHQNNYKLCNLNLLSCYGGLYPATLTKLSLVIFNQILSNKMYYKKDSKFYDKNEDKRIYTNVSVTPVTLLENCHPVKYRLESKDANKDAGNMVKKINELDDNNIFYSWKCGYPYNYMFVLERDIGLWKFYNPKAYVTPKTIRKILLSTNGMCNAMHKILQDNGDKSTVHEVRTSFCEFVDKIVKKMSPSVQDNLDKWDEGRGYREYLMGINEKIKKMNIYEGLEIDEGFCDRLPLEVQSKLFPKKRSINSHDELEDELAPKEESIVRQPKRRKRKPKEEIEAKFETFKSIDPLKDSKSFIQYYRSLLKTKNKKAEFNEYIVELQFAATILDKIKEANQDEEFLRSWISFYIESKLKGNYIRKKEKTSLKSLQQTYEEYNNRYIGCGV